MAIAGKIRYELTSNSPSMIRLAALLGLFVLLSSCITRQAPPTADELAVATYGPMPVAYENRMQRFVRAEYRDLQVIEVEVGTPRRGWYGTLGGIFVPRDVRFGWAVKFRGYRLGFTGMKPVVVGEVFFRDDVLEAIVDAVDEFRLVDDGVRW